MMQPAMYSRGGRVARYASPHDHMPAEMHFSGEGELFPVSLHYEMPSGAFARGGLADAARDVRHAGRYGDTEIIHVNKDELAELRQMWGEPTINPHTGQPEFFLSGLFKGIKKILKPLAPIIPYVAALIPGVGPAVAAGLKGLGMSAAGAAAAAPMVTRSLAGGVAGGITGGGRGALAGLTSGAISGGAGKMLGNAALGNTGLSPRVTEAIGNGVLGGLSSAAGGGDPLTGALLTGGGSYMLGAKPGAPQPITPQSNLAVDPASQGMTPEGNPAPNAAPTATPTQAGVSPLAPKSALLSRLRAELGNRNNLVAAIPGISTGMDLAAKAEAAADEKAQGAGILDKLQPVFNTQLPAPKGQFANLGVRQRAPTTYEEMIRYGYGPEASFFNNVPQGFAKGGAPLAVKQSPPRPRAMAAVSGPGSGRDDSIPAALSDGEYVMDAETVALLGDGSSKAGAKRLDDFRVAVRKHKGEKLAKGKFSVKAKSPERYMRGGAR